MPLDRSRRVFEEVACSSNLPKLDDVAVTFREMCRDLFAGRFEEAAEKYSAIEGVLHKEEILDVSTPVALIGLALAVRGKALGRMEKSSDGTDMFDRAFPEDILKLLAGHPFVRVDVIFHGRKEKGIPATIEYRSCEVTTTEGKAGALVLSLPDGVVESIAYPKPTLVRTGEATFTYYAMNKKELEVATVFADEGRDGVIAVPRSGIDKVKDVLERIAGCMPVAGSVACGVNADGELPEMLKGSVNFKIECSSAILRDCYADTGEVGYEVHGWDTRLLGCSYFNNKHFNLDNITIIKHTRGRLLVESGAFVKTTPNYKVYVGTGEVEWRNMMYSGFDSKDDCPGALYR